MKALEEDTKWVLGVDRRLVVIRALDTDGAFSASEVAERTGRSVQNVSRAMDEMETMGRTVVAHGVLNWTKDDHWGYTNETGVMLKVVNGDWKVE
mgnify:CR=1 FL=1